MKKLLSIIIMANLLVFSNVAFCDEPVTGTSILEIRTYETDRIFVLTGTNGSVVNPANCPAVTFAIDRGVDNFEEMYASLLVAMTTSGKVNLRISSTECVNNSVGGGVPTYPKITSVGINP